MEIKDGCTVRFWKDLWHPRGIELTGEIGTQKLGIRREARLCDVIVDGEWRFRNCRDSRIKEVIQGIAQFAISFNCGRS